MMMSTYYPLNDWPSMIPSQEDLEKLSRAVLIKSTGIAMFKYAVVAILSKIAMMVTVKQCLDFVHD